MSNISNINPFLHKVTNHTGTGQWIIAYQAEQRRRLKVTLTSAIKEQDIALQMESTHITPPENTPASTSARHRKMLDKKLLVKTFYTECLYILVSPLVETRIC